MSGKYRSYKVEWTVSIMLIANFINICQLVQNVGLTGELTCYIVHACVTNGVMNHNHTANHTEQTLGVFHYHLSFHRLICFQKNNVVFIITTHSMRYSMEV